MQLWKEFYLEINNFKPYSALGKENCYYLFSFFFFLILAIA